MTLLPLSPFTISLTFTASPILHRKSVISNTLQSGYFVLAACSTEVLLKLTKKFPQVNRFYSSNDAKSEYAVWVQYDQVPPLNTPLRLVVSQSENLKYVNFVYSHSQESHSPSENVGLPTIASMLLRHQHVSADLNERIHFELASPDLTDEEADCEETLSDGDFTQEEELDSSLTPFPCPIEKNSSSSSTKEEAKESQYETGVSDEQLNALMDKFEERQQSKRLLKFVRDTFDALSIVISNNKDLHD